MGEITAAPLLYKPLEAADRIRVSRARLYELMNAGEIESVKIGASRRIPADALQRYVDALPRES